jgi:hypothetical protein
MTLSDVIGEPPPEKSALLELAAETLRPLQTRCAARAWFSS